MAPPPPPRSAAEGPSAEDPPGPAREAGGRQPREGARRPSRRVRTESTRELRALLNRRGEKLAGKETYTRYEQKAKYNWYRSIYRHAIGRDGNLKWRAEMMCSAPLLGVVVSRRRARRSGIASHTMAAISCSSVFAVAPRAVVRAKKTVRTQFAGATKAFAPLGYVDVDPLRSGFYFFRAARRYKHRGAMTSTPRSKIAASAVVIERRRHRATRARDARRGDVDYIAFLAVEVARARRARDDPSAILGLVRARGRCG